MFHARSNGSRRRAVVAALTLVGALVGPRMQPAPIAQASAPAATPAPKRPYCAWPREAIGKQRFGNTGFIDTAGAYLLMPFAYLPGPSLRIHGIFPYARYMSFTLYSGRTNVLVDHLTDASIVPDRGSKNPFRPFANRNALRRSYTIYVVQGSPPASGRAPNTLYTGPYHPVYVMYRVYAPDRGADDFGNAPKPRLERLDGPPDSFTKALRVPECQTPQPAQARPNILIKFPLRWQRFGNLGAGGVNADDVYLQVRLNHDDADEYVVRFKAPTFANTYIGRRITGHEDVRLWSVCMYDMVSTRVVACIHDYQAVRSRSGYVTIVVSTYANKPASATPANGINWLPFGPEPIGMLTYRQVLPSPAFRGSFTNVAPDAYQFELTRALGRYMPTIQTCSLAAFTPTSCTDQIDPQLCTDLTEPAPCSPVAGSDRVANIPQ